MSEEDDMKVVETVIPEVKIITPKKFGDHRGFFERPTTAAIGLSGADVFGQLASPWWRSIVPPPN